MIEGLEGLLEGLAEWSVTDAPKPIRYGCVAILLALVIVPLGWAIWSALT